jgi:hypothetical protein
MQMLSTLTADLKINKRHIRRIIDGNISLIHHEINIEKMR